MKNQSAYMAALRPRMGRLAAWVACASALLLCVAAEAANPALGTILPRGAQRGTDVELTFQGDRLDDAVDVFFHDTGISLKSLTPENGNSVKALVAIDPNCRVGTQLIRLRTKSGISNAVLFSVGNLPESMEAEPNSKPEEAQAVTLNSTMNGVVDSEDVDYYAIDLNAGDRLAVEIEGLRLGGMLYTGMPFDPKVRLFGPEGHERVAADDTQSCLQDTAFVFVTEETGRHLVAVSDAAYLGNGNARYRLHVGNYPRPQMLSPMGGSAEQFDVAWLGDPGLAALPGVMPAADPLVLPAIDGIDPATLMFPRGTSRLTMAVTEQGIAPTPFLLRRIDIPVTKETEGNNTLGEATLGAIPGAFEGVLATEGDEDFFAFEGAPHGAYDVRVWARELGSPLDGVVDMWNPGDAHLGGNDDTYGSDPRMRVTVDADGRYKIRVRDHLGAGGETFAYRIEVIPVEPTLRTSLIENRPGSLTLHQGACSFLLVSANREDFDAPVRLWLDGVPQGVTPEHITIPAGATSTPIFFTAAADAPVAGSALRILGLGEMEGKFIAGDLKQEVRLVEGQNQTTFFGQFVDRVAVSVAEPAPFSIRIFPPQAPFVHGTGRNLTVEVTRNEGFSDAIALTFPYLPGGIKGGSATIPGDQNSAPIYLEVSSAAGEQIQNVFVQASAANYTLCSALTPIDIQPQWFNFDVPQVETEQGKPVELRVKVAQVKPFEGEFDVNLLSLPKGISTTPQKITKDTAELVFPIEVAADAPTGKHPSVMGEVYVTVNGEGVRHVSGGGQVTVFAPLPAELASQAPAPEAKPEGAPERKTRFSNS